MVIVHAPKLYVAKGIFYMDLCSLMFGTISMERVDTKRDRVCISLSTPLSEREMCDAIQVQAVR